MLRKLFRILKVEVTGQFDHGKPEMNGRRQLLAVIGRWLFPALIKSEN